MNIEIAKILREIGNSECIEKAEALEKDSGQTRALNLRNLELTPHHIIAIADVFREENNHDTNPITSISFSYNPRMGDRGATALARSLPISIREIGLVECGILDTGGRELLKWMKKSPNLTMICVEQNDFSEALKIEFTAFQGNNPHVMVVF